ncbi:MAG: NAD-dependent epimerase/dehydratase family protein [Thermoplasmata archaeon]|nr:NAD-dependent epimerase/dehydratase family protein [Thermoplasmata archaeon]
MTEGKKVLITGGAGFIGSHLAEKLCSDNDVVVLDNLDTGSRDNLSAIKEDVSFVEGDIRDGEAVKDALREADLVFHCAAQISVERSVENPAETNQINVEGTLRVLDQCRKEDVERFVFVSSSSVYGSGPELPKREDMQPNPESPYAESKIKGEQHCRQFNDLHGLPCVILRCFNVYGSRQQASSPYASVIPRFISAILRDQKPIVFGDGEQTRDFIFVDDVVDALSRAADVKNARGETINIASARPISILGLLEVLGEIFNREIEPEFRDERPGDVRHSVADVSKAKDILGFSPRVELADGLRRTVDHLRALS